MMDILRKSAMTAIAAVVLLMTVHAGLHEVCCAGDRSLEPRELPRSGHVLPLNPLDTGLRQTSQRVPALFDSGYWLVSSRHCPTPEIDTKPCCLDELAYYRVGLDGKPCRIHPQTFRASLDPRVPVCIAVHGSYVSQKSLIESGPSLYSWLRTPAPHCPIQVVYFSWPSKWPISYIPNVDIALLGRRAALHGYYLAQLVSNLPPSQPVSFFGHSHGARVVASSLHLIGGGFVKGLHLQTQCPCQRRYRVVFAAAALDHHWLNPGERYGRALDVTECVLNLKNRQDIALHAYPLRRLFSRRALGRIGFTIDDQSLLGSTWGHVTELDVSQLVSTGHLWHNYHRCPEIAAAMSPYVYFDFATGPSVPRQDSPVDLPSPDPLHGQSR